MTPRFIIRACSRQWTALLVALVGATFCSVTLRAGAATARFRLTSRGQAKVEIVLNQTEAPMVFAAQELQRYVKEMSGAELPLVHSLSKKPAIILAYPLFKPKAGVSLDPRDEEAYRLSIDAKALRIEGATPRAVLF